ncbi:hypothetical protein IM660_10365 [Ruania alkalisoli]|uniref:Uncharacterized protein n=1 Tax=Ruania alkalisoli TaxID=2779775 RepID=A0A7M1SNL2_9MICO|nr:hypothetical protein [Ruania alkalisoli]QOR69138.1 hypothetical protein IM660_10365 [Ruania alkalisoli]
MTEVEIPTLASMTPRAQTIALAYYSAGVLRGIEIGRGHAEDEQAELDRRAAAVVAVAADGVPLDVLAERRGEHAHAERVRDRLRRNGVVA